MPDPVTVTDDAAAARQQPPPRRRSPVPLIALLLAVAIAGLLLYGMVNRGDGGAAKTLDDAVKQGQRPVAPGAQITMPALSGDGSESLAKYRGKIVVLNLWASWCAPCRQEAPALREAQAQFDSDGKGTVLGATFNDPVKKSRAFVKELKLTFPNARDVGTKLAREYGTRNLPETFVIDREGRVVAISRGALDRAWLTEAIRSAEGS